MRPSNIRWLLLTPPPPYTPESQGLHTNLARSALVRPTSTLIFSLTFPLIIVYTLNRVEIYMWRRELAPAPFFFFFFFLYKKI